MTNRHLLVALSHDRHFPTGIWCTCKNCPCRIGCPQTARLDKSPHGKNNRPVKNCRFGFYRYVDGARPLGIARCSATTESELAVSSESSAENGATSEQVASGAQPKWQHSPKSVVGALPPEYAKYSAKAVAPTVAGCLLVKLPRLSTQQS